MKAVCINIENLTVNNKSALAVGEIYDVDDANSEYYYLKNDENKLESYYKYRFKLLDEIREEKLNELGI